MKRQIQGMVIVITGASAGIGEELATQLHQAGARLVLSARREEVLHALNAKLGGGHLVVPCDVAEEGQCKRLIEASQAHYGRLDTIVANAGYGFFKPTAEVTRDEMEQIFRANVFGTGDCINAAAKVMADQAERDGWRGQLMIVSSATARRGLPFMAYYSASKAAQLMVAESMRVELAPQKIAVTSVHPISTRTNFFDIAHERSAGLKRPAVSTPVWQSAPQVARAMVKGIVKPTAEVWPHRPSRWR